MNKSMAAAAIAALIALGGCSTQTEAKAPEVEAAGAGASQSPSPKARDKDRSERGNLIKEFGQGAGLSNEDGDQVVDFVVNSITPVTCTGEFATAPVNGNMLALDVSIKTYPELADDPYPIFTLSPYQMKVIAPNGTTSNADLASPATYSCLPDGELIPSAGLGPAENVTGKILIDSEVPSGTLVISAGPGAGWEYTF